MLTVKATPNLYGVTLRGDYDDLNSLYDSLYDYLEFYNDSHEEFPDHEYEYLLSLNYDIRHCYQGDRNVEKAEDGHTYYSVEILYPPSMTSTDFTGVSKKKVTLSRRKS